MANTTTHLVRRRDAFSVQLLMVSNDIACTMDKIEREGTPDEERALISFCLKFLPPSLITDALKRLQLRGNRGESPASVVNGPPRSVAEDLGSPNART